MFFAAATQAKPQPFAARVKRENQKAKCFEGKGPVAQWSDCRTWRLKITMIYHNSSSSSRGSGSGSGSGR